MSSSFTARSFSAGMARFTCGGSPRRSETIPITRPRSSTAALPPQEEMDGDSTSARSSMYSQKAEKRRTACSVLAACTRSPSSSTPTVPVTAPTATSPEGISVAAGHGPAPFEAHDGQAGVEIETRPAWPARVRPSLQVRLDPRGVEHHIAHRHRVSPGVEHDPGAAEPPGAQPRGGRTRSRRRARAGRRAPAPPAARRTACAGRSSGFGRGSRTLGTASASTGTTSKRQQGGHQTGSHAGTLGLIASRTAARSRRGTRRT